MYSLSKSLKKVQIKLADQLDAQNNNIELKISDLEKQFPGVILTHIILIEILY